MKEFEFVNAGYNIPEFSGLRFNWCLYQHAFLYFQGPAIVNGKRVDAGACILYKKYTVHDYVTLNGFVNSYIGFQAPEEIFSSLGIKCDKVIFPDNCEEINKIIFDICREDSKRRRGWSEEITALIIKLLVAVSRGTEAKTYSSKETDVKKKMSFLRAEYLAAFNSAPDIDEIIRRSGFSRTRFYRLYNQFFHVSPKDDLIRTRLDTARSLIRENPSKKMYEIASLCGFTDIPHFFRLFKKRYGYTPKDYARAVQASDFGL